MIPSKVSVELGKTKTVKAEWENFSKQIFKDRAPSRTQIDETEKAFYAGFYDCLALFLFGVAEEESEERGAEILEALKNECDSYFKDKLKDYLKSKN